MSDAIERLAAIEREATPGKWGWAGYIDGTIEVRSRANMAQTVVTAMRSESCVVQLADESVALTVDACESCRAEAAKTLDPWVDYRCPKEANLATLWLCERGVLRPANEWAVREVPYRGDVVAVDHPDAILITEARNALPALLDIARAAERVTMTRGHVERVQAIAGLRCALAALDAGDRT